MKISSSVYDEDCSISFKGIFDSYYKNLCFFAYQILDDKDLAEDVAQDAFLAYWHQMDKMASHEKVIRSYLYTTAKFIALNKLRHQKVANRYSCDTSSYELEEEEVMEKMIRAEVISEIHQALDTLPEACKEILRLGYFEGLSNAKIAEVLSISINTVKTQKQRGLKALRMLLKPETFSFFVLVILNK